LHQQRKRQNQESILKEIAPPRSLILHINCEQSSWPILGVGASVMINFLSRPLMHDHGACYQLKMALSFFQGAAGMALSRCVDLFLPLSLVFLYVSGQQQFNFFPHGGLLSRFTQRSPRLLDVHGQCLHTQTRPRLGLDRHKETATHTHTHIQTYTIDNSTSIETHVVVYQKGEL